MKILLLATHDSGGAGSATLRLHKTLREAGLSSCLYVKYKTSSEKDVIEHNERHAANYTIRKVKKKIGNLFERISGNVDFATDPNYCFFNKYEDAYSVEAKDILKQIPFIPDVIIAGWISRFINTQSLYDLNKDCGAKVFWLTTDMGPLTGGCHYSWDCKGYMNDCSDCPAILDRSKKGQAAKNLAIKKEFIRKCGLEVWAGSDQLYAQLRCSSLFKHQKEISKVLMIIDQEIFSNKNRKIAKQIFGIPKNKKVIFAGANNNEEARKGGAYFKETLKHLYNLIKNTPESNLRVEDIVLLVAGNNSTENEWFRDIPFSLSFLSFITDDRLLSTLYQASDIYLCTSIQDSGPMMINEAVMCGTPVVSFDIGVSGDLVVRNKSGYRARYKDSLDMAMGLFEVLQLSEKDYEKLSDQTYNLALNKTSKPVVLKSIIASLNRN